MKLVLRRRISISIRSSENSNECGDNLILSVQIEVQKQNTEAMISREWESLMDKLDHQHLSDHSSFGFSSLSELAFWLDKSLRERGFTPEVLLLKQSSGQGLRLI